MAFSKSLQIINAGNGAEEREPLLHCRWGGKLTHPLQRTVWSFLKKPELEPPEDSVIPLLGTYPERTILQKIRTLHLCMWMTECLHCSPETISLLTGLAILQYKVKRFKKIHAPQRS